MTRRQVVGFGVVVVLLVAAFVVQAMRSTEPAAQAVDLAPLREAAALEPCPPGIGKELPDLVLPCLGGGDVVRLQGAGPGIPLLVNAWGTWCSPCKREIPELVLFAARAKGKVGVVGVLSQDEPEKGLAFSRDFGIHYPSVVDDDGVFFRSYSAGPPVTVFVAADGTIPHVERGEIATLAEMVALVKTHLGVAV